MAKVEIYSHSFGGDSAMWIGNNVMVIDVAVSPRLPRAQKTYWNNLVREKISSLFGGNNNSEILALVKLMNVEMGKLNEEVFSKYGIKRALGLAFGFVRYFDEGKKILYAGISDVYINVDGKTMWKEEHDMIFFNGPYKKLVKKCKKGVKDLERHWEKVREIYAHHPLGWAKTYEGINISWNMLDGSDKALTFVHYGSKKNVNRVVIATDEYIFGHGKKWWQKDVIGYHKWLFKRVIKDSCGEKTKRLGLEPIERSVAIIEIRKVHP